MTTGEAFTYAGYVVGALVFLLAARRKRLATEGIGWVALAGLVGGIVGAKLTQWLVAGGPAGAMLDPRVGGRTLLGGLIGGWLVVEAAKRLLGIRRSTGDLFALALPAGEAVGRVGCFLNGCCYGTPAGAGVAWAVFQHGKLRHPAQLYSAAFDVVLLGVLLAASGRLKREGDLFRLYLVLFGLGRFGLEFWRQRTLAFAGLSLAQLLCLETVAVVGVTWLVMRARRQASGPAGAGAPVEA